MKLPAAAIHAARLQDCKRTHRHQLVMLLQNLPEAGPVLLHVAGQVAAGGVQLLKRCTKFLTLRYHWAAALRPERRALRCLQT
jgi:hypothetical protein